MQDGAGSKMQNGESVKHAAIQYQKHTVSKIITPEQNQTADAWKFGYRTVGIAEAKDNKKVAIYVHKAGE